MKTITISIAENGAVSSHFNGPQLYEAIGAVAMTLDLLRETARSQNNMYTGEKPKPGEEKKPEINNN